MTAGKELYLKGPDPFSESKHERENLELRVNKSITSTLDLETCH
jgi:hypothetical protein